MSAFIVALVLVFYPMDDPLQDVNDTGEYAKIMHTDSGNVLSEVSPALVVPVHRSYIRAMTGSVDDTILAMRYAQGGTFATTHRVMKIPLSGPAYGEPDQHCATCHQVAVEANARSGV